MIRRNFLKLWAGACSLPLIGGVGITIGPSRLERLKEISLHVQCALYHYMHKGIKCSAVTEYWEGRIYSFHRFFP